MNAVPVSYKSFATGDLPNVCIKSGVPTTDRLRRSFVLVPGWTWVLLLFGILPWFIARAFARERVHGVLPMSERVYRRLRAAEQFTAGTLVSTVVLFVSALLFGSRALALAGAVALCASAIGMAVVWVRGIGVGRGDKAGQLLLTRVSAEFARECGRRQSSVVRTSA